MIAPAGKAAGSADRAGPAIPLDSLPQVPKGQGPILVWFKHDLRISDHPGLLAAAATGRPVVPFFCLDPEAYADLALQPSGAKSLVDALTALRAALRGVGSDLVLRVGPMDDSVAAFCASIGADTVMTEREVEARWLESKHRLSISLQQKAPSTRVAAWSAPLYTPGAFHPNFRSWRKARGAALEPLPPPAALPALPGGCKEAAGDIPGAAEVEALLQAALAQGVGDVAARSILEKVAGAEAATAAAGRRAPTAARAAPFVERLLQALPELQGGSAAAAPGAHTAAGGPAEVAALRAYLSSHLSAPLTPGLGFLSEAVKELEGPANPGGSYLALLGRPLGRLGRLSLRQVHAEALEFERRRWGGRIPPLGPSTPTARAALVATELSDFHSQLATFDSKRGSGKWRTVGAGWAPEPVASAGEGYEEGDGGAVASWGGAASWPPGVARRCAWRWRGALTDYCVAEPAGAPREGAPAVLLCHGFGAFGDQWRGNLAALAAEGYRVYAPTLPGFGRSEKAAIGYSQEAWRDFLRDFILRVAKGPVVLVGNSIGGFISASVAADYPELVRGLCLINSAGPIDPAFDISAHAAKTKKPPPAWLAGALTAGLMAYLEGSIAGQLKWLYPTAPERADTWLEQEIFRAACDGRSPDVFRSVFYLPPPRALNWMVKDAWRGPTLVLQGVLDPLNDAKGRAAQLEALCPNARAVLLQAGHCPQDEQPQAVNAALLQWIEADILGAAAGGDGAGGAPLEAAAAAAT